eukprot:CAMPEP_0172377210 /NCGR_PEP_ID=MMETSP1060-20121228/68782_2 /TAXON_ID=37318 /ORGANISM="Pseudo-nitzschia pungens, Strain cf. cingulata" /LENGTH=388 /DNA_ID=CAMNT_0013104879 /DNA_START=1 /DNA_END=1170 /DNA_ORIENTATION=-
MVKAVAIPLCVVTLTISHLIAEVGGIQPHQHVVSNKLFPVLFESKRVLVVRKPHGIGHHDESSSSTVLNDDNQGDNDYILPGVIRLLRNERHRETLEEGERLYGVHRLDKVTSGILVLAKDASTASALSDFFARSDIQKIYFGLSTKKPKKKKQGLVQGGMGRSRNKSWKLIRAPKAGTKSQDMFAKTRFFTTGLNSINIMRDGGTNDTSNIDPTATAKTVVMFRPYTGRTHQLRVAAKAMGIPLLGDPIYKDGSAGNGIDSDDPWFPGTIDPTATAKTVVMFRPYTGNGIDSDDPWFPGTRTMLHASGIHIPKFLDHEEINIWCPPTFFHDDEEKLSDGLPQDDAFDTRKSRSLLADALGVAVANLMTKNCDVPGILEAMTTDPTRY